ncbi:unnamed protein product [Polarella glacialis]|uniref:Pentacotripeptide-repeat region of PRORP domain-containing protein n=1 Tax=Polarella glacialis TaxID=89957 RepID=A0A813EGD6_POLGL|nr:unnamed protein product [Polarella glacialis]
MDAALGFFAEMTEQGLVDVVSYTTIIKGHFSAGTEQHARQVLREMQERGIAANRITYNIFLSLWVKRGDSDLILLLVDEMKAIPNSQAASSMSSLVSAYVHNQQIRQALSAHDTGLRQDLCSYDDKIYTGIARALLQVGAVDKAAEVVRCAYHLPAHTLLQTRGSPPGVDEAVVGDVVLALGYYSIAGRALMKDLSFHRQVSVSCESLLGKQAKSTPQSRC